MEILSMGPQTGDPLSDPGSHTKRASTAALKCPVKRPANIEKYPMPDFYCGDV